MLIDEMKARKIKWQTVDDGNEEFPRSAVEEEFTPDLVTLEPQRIRVFSLKFTPKSTDVPTFLN